MVQGRLGVSSAIIHKFEIDVSFMIKQNPAKG